MLKTCILTALLSFTSLGFAAQSDCPLHDAARLGKLAEVQHLLQQSIDVEARYNGDTALHSLVSYRISDLPGSAKPEETLQALLDANVDIRAVDHNGRRPLQLASLFGNHLYVQLLLRNGAPVDDVDEKEGKTALHFAARGGVDIVRTLLLARAPVNARDLCGNTPLHEAVTHTDRFVVEALILADTDLTIRNHQNQSAWHLTQNQAFRTLLQQHDEGLEADSH